MSRKKKIYFICDRCGAHFENEDDKVGLCGKCAVSLMKWWENGK